MPHPKDLSALTRWEHHLIAALAEDPLPWNAHDPLIQVTVAEYNQYLQKTPEYIPLDWRWIKAVCWVESGAYSPVWNKNPMQIGAFAVDPGMETILSTRQGSIILPPKYKSTLNTANVPVISEKNIQAGTGYFLERLAYFGHQRLSRKSAATQSGDNTSYGINGWRHVTFKVVADRYNGGGDGNYAGKLAFAWGVITGKKGSAL